METIKVNFGRINGEKVWSVCSPNDKGCVIARSVVKSHIDKVLPRTETDEDYFRLVARYMSKVFFSILDDNGVKYDKKEFAFNCEGQIYSHK